MSPKATQVLLWVAGIALLAGATIAAVFFLRWEYFKKNAESILRQRVIETLQNRFQCRVELDQFHLSVGMGIGVNGSGLRLYPNPPTTPAAVGTQPNEDTKAPLIEVSSFSFRTDWQELRKKPLHVDHVNVDGLHINLPPKVQGQPRFPLKANPPDPYNKHSGVSIVVDELDCTNATLLFGTSKPGKLPLDFEIGKLNLERVGGGMPMRFQAELVNPRPVGNVHSNGNFGPWNQEVPGDTPISGVYEFDHANLGDFKGIAGILSSTGKFAGALEKITVDGHTDTPDFRVTISGHPVALHTDFHAIVDGMNGDTYLQPVNATFLHTHLIAAGKVVRIQEPKGHLIQLNVTVDHGRVEDLLRLGVKTVPPVMAGDIRLKTAFDLPPGHDISVTDRLRLTNGTFTVTDGHFESDKVQKKIDLLSKLGQGITKDSTEPPPVNVASQINGGFKLESSRLTLSELDYTVPGARVGVDGVYSLDGRQFDFHGVARLHAKLSQMTTGWKSLLLMPMDKFFEKHGAGTEVPFKVTGANSEPKFGLDFGHHDDALLPPEKPTAGK
jgi:hypothetical protein